MRINVTSVLVDDQDKALRFYADVRFSCVRFVLANTPRSGTPQSANPRTLDRQVSACLSSAT